MKKMIINGANGYVASNFINELLQQNYKVVALVRSNSKYTSKERMRAALLEMSDGRVKNLENLEVYDYSLFEEGFALSEDELTEIFAGNLYYFHFAASLKFDLKSKDEIFSTNLRGVTNSVNTFLKYTNSESRFFLVSTAYSCGRLNGIFEERFYNNEEIERFRNYYEQSKRYAENVIKEYIEERDLNATILRLSQVVGNNKTGVTKTDYGIFDFSKRVQNLALKYPGSTIRLKVDPDSTQNLIPIDTVVAYLMSTVKAKEIPQILNLIAKRSISNREILCALNKILPITLIADMKLEKEQMNTLERIMSVGMSFTGAYINTKIQFDTTNLDRIVEELIPEISARSVYRMLEFFLNDFRSSRSSNLKPAV